PTENGTGETKSAASKSDHLCLRKGAGSSHPTLLAYGLLIRGRAPGCCSRQKRKIRFDSYKYECTNLPVESGIRSLAWRPQPLENTTTLHRITNTASKTGRGE